MTDIYLVCTGNGCKLSKYIAIVTNNAADVGKYIREHLNDFYFMFEEMALSDCYGKIQKDLFKIYEEKDLYRPTEHNRDRVIEAIGPVLAHYTDEEIVKEMYGYVTFAGRQYATITKIKSNKIITL